MVRLLDGALNVSRWFVGWVVQYMGEIVRRLVGRCVSVLGVTLVSAGWFACWLVSNFVGG